MKWTDLPALAALSGMIALSSCETSDLCYDHSHVVNLKVNLDWSQAPDASPTSVSLYLFPRSGGETIRYELTEHDGATIRVEKGEYDAICVNSDTYNVIVEDTHSFSTCHITTGETSPRRKGSRATEIPMLEPEPVYHGILTSINLSDETILNEITMVPEEATETFVVNITDVENLNHAVAVEAELTGMAAGFYGATKTLSDQCATFPFRLSIARDKSSLKGEIRTFGHCPADIAEHKLNIHVDLDDGTEWTYTYDVTRQLDYAKDSDNLLALEGLPIPATEGGGVEEGDGGFQPSVNDWGEAEHTIIPMGGK